MNDVIRIIDLTARLIELHTEMGVALRRGDSARFNQAMSAMEFAILLERGNALNAMESYEAGIPAESPIDASMVGLRHDDGRPATDEEAREWWGVTVYSATYGEAA